MRSHMQLSIYLNNFMNIQTTTGIVCAVNDLKSHCCYQASQLRDNPFLE